KEEIYNAAKAWCADVEAGAFPSLLESFALDEKEREALESCK
ncbi:hypothetical protein tpqmel_1024, partial [Candidatus Gastranaerophilus sp. (ex Termes propinquus)]